VRHLIKDCPTLKERREAAAEKDNEREAMSSGIPRTAGADEDDFMVQSRVRMAEMGGDKKGKREKKPFNNNGLREPYKQEGRGEGAEGGQGEASAGPVVAVAKPKSKAKVVAF
jgi:zinc finger CCHC domain-containing protein 9